MEWYSSYQKLWTAKGIGHYKLRINSKPEYYHLARQGLLGNTIRQWTVEEFCRIVQTSPGSVPRRVAVRGRTPACAKYQGYDLTHGQAITRCWQAGFRGHQVFIDEQAPDHRCLIKGEVMRDERYWYMRYDCTPGLRMREAYPIMKHAWGLTVECLLKHFMDASSWDCLQDLFDRYPEACVEFSVYDHAVGHYQWNTVFWEVRNY